MNHAPKKGRTDAEGRVCLAFARVLLCLLLTLVSAGCKRKNRGPAFDAVKLAVGEESACARMVDASVVCWGADGSESHRLAVRKMPSGSDVVALAVGHSATCTVSEGGVLGCIGTRVPAGLTGVADVALGDGFVCARRTSGAVTCWTPTTPPVDVPHLGAAEAQGEAHGEARVEELVAGSGHACARLLDGSVRCWGKNDDGQLGDGTTDARATLTTAAPVRGLVAAVGLAAGGGHTCALLPDRGVRCWGRNDHGQLGDGTTMRRPTPVDVAQLSGVRGIALGEGHSCARLEDATVHCWGQNDVGELANGTTQDHATPLTIPGLFNVTDVRLGSRTTCALTEDHRIWCWGRNDRGQSGDGSTSDRPVPVAVRFQAP